MGAVVPLGCRQALGIQDVGSDLLTCDLYCTTTAMTLYAKGLAHSVLGEIADWTSIDTVYRLCSFLPLIGLLTAFLPDVERPGIVKT